MADEDEGLRDRLSRQGEEALGKLASDLLENPLINSAITRAFSAREKAVHAQEAAMGALNLPSAADIDRLTRRLRTVGTRLEGIEEAIDRLQDGVDRLSEQARVGRPRQRPRARRSARRRRGSADQARQRDARRAARLPSRASRSGSRSTRLRPKPARKRAAKKKA